MIFTTPDSVTQRGIVAAVADRGYLDGYTLDQRIARQLVKELEEVCEALQCIQDAPSGGRQFSGMIQWAHDLGLVARAVFDVPSLFDGVTVDVPVLIEELPDLVVPLAVLADAVGVPDMLGLASAKAWADVARGVRNGALPG